MGYILKVGTVIFTVYWLLNKKCFIRNLVLKFSTRMTIRYILGLVLAFSPLYKGDGLFSWGKYRHVTKYWDWSYCRALFVFINKKWRVIFLFLYSWNLIPSYIMLVLAFSMGIQFRFIWIENRHFQQGVLCYTN